MRILQADLPAFLTQTLQNIRAGLEAAIADGIIVEMPDYVDISVEVVQAPGAVTTVTGTSGSQNSTRQGTTTPQTQTTTDQPVQETTVEDGYVETTTDGGSTETSVEASTQGETTTRVVNQQSNDQGSDGETTTYSYQSYS